MKCSFKLYLIILLYYGKLYFTVQTAFPSVLEYLPYRKSDWTAARDRLRHPWLASHGFVVCRADLRGSGDSSGVYYDEYVKQELDDGCEIIGELLQNDKFDDESCYSGSI